MIAQLDESVPARLSRVLADVGCRALRFPKEWKGLSDAQLLAKIRRSGVHCLITCDKNLRYQQDLSRHGIALIVLPRQRLTDLLPYLDAIAAAANRSNPGEAIEIADTGQAKV